MLFMTHTITLKELRPDLPKVVENIDEKPVRRRPMPPFITSTLQQEGSRKLGLTARETMRVAQGLYEKGFITYMRTDSTQLSVQALAAAKKCILELHFGAAFFGILGRLFRFEIISEFRHCY